MIDYTLDTATSILYVRPKTPLEQDDFVQLGKTVDSFIEAKGDLVGLIVEAPSFPGWASFGALITHFCFVRDHHKHIKKVALVTDSALGTVGELLAAHFVSADIRRFPAGELDAAEQWVMNREDPV